MQIIQSRLSQLKSRSSKVANVFLKTANDFEVINKEIEKEQDKILAEISQREASHDELETQKLANQKIVDNINRLFM